MQGSKKFRVSHRLGPGLQVKIRKNDFKLGEDINDLDYFKIDSIIISHRYNNSMIISPHMFSTLVCIYHV